MTNYKQAQCNKKRGGNQRDQWTAPKPKSQHDDFLKMGFIQNQDHWNRLDYKVPDFPTFTLAPGIIGVKSGMVAKYTMIDIEMKILFPYGTPPATIKVVLEVEAELWTVQTARNQLVGELIPF